MMIVSTSFSGIMKVFRGDEAERAAKEQLEKQRHAAERLAAAEHKLAAEKTAEENNPSASEAAAGTGSASLLVAPATTSKEAEPVPAKETPQEFFASFAPTATNRPTFRPTSDKELPEYVDIGQDLSQVIRSRDDVMFDSIRKQQRARQTSLWGAQISALQTGVEREEEEKDSFGKQIAAWQSGGSVSSGGKGGGAAAVAKGGAAADGKGGKAASEQFAGKMKSGLHQLPSGGTGEKGVVLLKGGKDGGKKGGKGKKTAWPNPANAMTWGQQQIPETSSDPQAGSAHPPKEEEEKLLNAEPLDLATIDAEQWKKCATLIGAQLGGGAGMLPVSTLDIRLRTIVRQNKSCRQLLANLDPARIFFQPDRVFVTAPAYLPHLLQRQEDQKLLRKIPLDLVDEIFFHVKQHLEKTNSEDAASAQISGKPRTKIDAKFGLQRFGLQINSLREKLEWGENSIRERMFGGLETHLKDNLIAPLFFYPEMCILTESVAPMICLDAVPLKNMRARDAEAGAKEVVVELRKQQAKRKEEADALQAKEQAAKEQVSKPGAGESSGEGEAKNISEKAGPKKKQPKRTYGAAPVSAQYGSWGAGGGALSSTSVNPQNADKTTTSGTVFYTDPFRELCVVILLRLKQKKGQLPSEKSVLPLVSACKYRFVDLNYALSPQVFWSYDSQCEVLFRTHKGSSQHADPLPQNALPDYLKTQIISHIRKAGANVKVNEITKKLSWNRKSELSQTHGMFKSVLARLRELFYDPYHLYLKENLDGIVDWPSSKSGKLYNRAQTDNEREVLTRQLIDETAEHVARIAELPEIQLKRQVLGFVMQEGRGYAEMENLEKLLEMLQIGTLDRCLAEPYNLGKVLIVPGEKVFLKKGVLVERFLESVSDLILRGESPTALPTVPGGEGVAKELPVQMCRVLDKAGGVMELADFHKELVKLGEHGGGRKGRKEAEGDEEDEDQMDEDLPTQTKALLKSLTLEQTKDACSKLKEIFWYSPNHVWLQMMLDDVVKVYPGTTEKFFLWAVPQEERRAKPAKRERENDEDGADISIKVVGAPNKEQEEAINQTGSKDSLQPAAKKQKHSDKQTGSFSSLFENLSEIPLML